MQFPASLLWVGESLVALPRANCKLASAVLRENWLRHQAAPLADEWARANGWRISKLDVQDEVIRVSALSPPPKIAAGVANDCPAQTTKRAPNKSD